MERTRHIIQHMNSCNLFDALRRWQHPERSICPPRPLHGQVDRHVGVDAIKASRAAGDSSAYSGQRPGLSILSGISSTCLIQPRRTRRSWATDTTAARSVTVIRTDPGRAPSRERQGSIAVANLAACLPGQVNPHAAGWAPSASEVQHVMIEMASVLISTREGDVWAKGADGTSGKLWLASGARRFSSGVVLWAVVACTGAASGSPRPLLV